MYSCVETDLAVTAQRLEGNWVPGQGSLVVADRAESKTHQSLCLSCRPGVLEL